MVQAPEELVIVQTTVDSEKDAQKLAALALDRRLAACVQITTISSHYRWNGERACDREWRLDCKTSRSAADGLMRALARAHPYDEPELIVLPVLTASKGYAAWVREEVVTGSGG